MAAEKVHQVYRKANFITEDLRNQILSKTFSPGERLPTRDALVEKYGVGKVTVQRAVKILMDEGFVEARVGRGTIISERSPHLVRYAMLFPQSQEMTERNQFWLALIREAQRFEDKREVEIHYGFEGGQGVDRYNKLVNDVENGRLAGLIFASAPAGLKNTPLLASPGIPRAAFMSTHPVFDIPNVMMDGTALHQKIVKYTLTQNCHRIALIASDHQSIESVGRIKEVFESHGLSINPDWIHGVSRVEPGWAKSLTRLLMADSSDKRPDCLVVLDDNLVPVIAETLKEINIIPPHDIKLVAHCNFPWPTPSVVPAMRMGFCITELLRSLMQQIDDQQEGRIPKRNIVINAYDELDYPGHIQECEESR